MATTRVPFLLAQQWHAWRAVVCSLVLLVAAIIVPRGHVIAAQGATQATATSDAMHLFFTGNVKGQMLPVRTGKRGRRRVHECADMPCSCAGGAHRRLAVLAAARRKHPHAILIETGGFAPSTGASTVIGNRSIANAAGWLAKSGYDVFALSKGDFLLDAHARAGALSEYIAPARRMSEHAYALPPAVITNFVGTGTHDCNVARHTIVELPNSRTFAFLAAFDPWLLCFRQRITPDFMASNAP